MYDSDTCDTCDYAANRGHLNCLKYAHDHHMPWDEETCAYAARTGHLDCLRYLHDHGCPWDEKTCQDASAFGNLDYCLIYAHTNESPWDKWTCENAAIGGHLNCLKYLYKEKCPGYQDQYEKVKEPLLKTNLALFKTFSYLRIYISRFLKRHYKVGGKGYFHSFNHFSKITWK